MGIATKTDTILTATITQANLATAIKAAMVNAGFSNSFDDFTSTNRILIYETVIDSSKTYGKVYLWVSITTALIISTAIYATWNATSHTGTGGSTINTMSTLIPGTNIFFTAYNAGSELKGIQLVQGSVVVPIFVLVPETRPSWYDLANWSYGFTNQTSGLGNWRSASINPYSNDSLVSTLNTATLSGANPQTNRRDVMAGILLLSATNNGIACKTSENIVAVAGTGAARYDIIQPQGTTQQYSILNPSAGGMAVRIN